MLRVALVKAGLVERYEHVCRRAGCRAVEAYADDAPRRCAKCYTRLWARPIPIALRFHDLRSTFATQLYERTKDITLVQKALGRTTPVLTASTYAGIRDEHARELMNTLRFGIPPLVVVDPGSAPVSGTGPARRPGEASAAVPADTEVARNTANREARDAQFEPSTFGFGGRHGELSARELESQGVESVHKPGNAVSAGLSADGRVSASVSGTGPARSGTVEAGGGAGLDERVLTVREVATALRVSTATVYGWIHRGQLSVVRVAGAFVRVRQRELERLLRTGAGE